MGARDKDELFSTDRRTRRAQELEEILATSRCLIEEVEGLTETSQRLIRERDALIASRRRQAARRGK